MTAITGNTYPVKDSLKALGARWNPDQKVWMIDDTKADQAKEIVAKGASQPASSERRAFVHHKCTVCGVKASRYQKILRSGECWDCYEERKMGY
jgi:hypothetical protein